MAPIEYKNGRRYSPNDRPSEPLPVAALTPKSTPTKNM